MLGVSASVSSRSPDQANQSYEEVIQIFRRLAKENPVDYAHNLASTLSDVGRHYHNTQRLKEAEEAYRESLEVYRDVAEVSPDYLIIAVGVLESLAQIYNDIQRAEDAMSAREEAERLRRGWQAMKLPISWRRSP